MSEGYFHRVKNPAKKSHDEIIAELIEAIEDNIGDKMKNSDRRHLFTVISEVIQNVLKYSVEGQKSYFDIGYDDDRNVVISTQNVTTAEHKERLEKIVDSVSYQSKAEVNARYNDLLKESQPDEPSGGLGVTYIKANTIQQKYRIKALSDDLYEVNVKILY